MTRRTFTFFVTVLTVTAAGGGSAAGDQVRGSGSGETTDEIERLRQCLDRQVHTSRRVRWGVAVRELPSGKLLYAQNAELPFNPASNAKLATFAAALSRLGPDHRFSTALLGRVRRGEVRGTLWLRGSLDPSLTTERLDRMARDLRGLGVQRIQGPLAVDSSTFAGPARPPGFRRFRSSHPFRAGVGAPSLNHNVIRVAVAPGEGAGTRARVTLEPQSRYLTPKVLVWTTRGRTRLRVSTHPEGDGHTLVKVTGRINLRASSRVFWRRVFHPLPYTGATLLARLQAAGIRVTDPRVELRRLPSPPPPVLLEQRSEPLSSMVRTATKHSSNIVAELLLLALGSDQYGAPASYAKGRKAVSQYLSQHGIDPKRFRLENGSGLSRRSLIRPADLVRLLQAVYADFGLGSELLSALPLAGVDGTLQHRFRSSSAQGRLRAKTGTLSGVTSLSGFVAAEGRHGSVLAFSILGRRLRRVRGMVWRRDAMARCLLRHGPGTRLVVAH